MLNFIKSFGLGLLYMILSPVLLLVLLAFSIYGLYNFVVTGFAGLVRFFKGQKFFPEFEEDVKAERLLDKGLENDGEESKTPAEVKPATTNVYVQQNIYQGVPPQNNQPNFGGAAVPPLPNARIPDIPGVDHRAIEQANAAAAASPTAIEQKAPESEDEVIDITMEDDDGQQ